MTLWKECGKRIQRGKLEQIFSELGSLANTLQSSPPLALKCDNIVGGRSENILKRREWPYCEFGSLVKTRQMSPSIAPKTGDILEGCSKTVLVR